MPKCKDCKNCHVITDREGLRPTWIWCSVLDVAVDQWYNTDDRCDVYEDIHGNNTKE